MTDGNGHTSHTYYDLDSNVTQTTDDNGQNTSYSYDTDDRQTSMTDPLGHTSQTFYDANGNVTQTTDALGDSKETAYDSDGRVTSQTDGDGKTTTLTYDGDGHTLSVTDPDNNTTTYQYDTDARQTLMIAPTGARMTTTYDNAGNVSTVIDGDSRTTTYSYDGDNRETGETWKNSGGTTTDVLTFTYDNGGNMLTASNATGSVSLGYNSDNQASSQTDVFGLTTNYSYDGNGRVTQRTDALGGTSNSSFDGNGNLTSAQFSGTGQSPVRADLAYTPDNQLSTLTRYDSLTAVSANVVGTTVYSYDNADRVTAITTKDSGGTTIAAYDYAYDNANRVTVLTTQSGGPETFTYDAASQLLSDHLNGSPTTTYSYDSNGDRNMSGYSTTTGNEMTNDGTYTYTYDNVGNRTEQAAATGSTVMYYTYNQKNQITSIRVTSNGTTNVSWTTFTYDALNRRVEQDTWQSVGGNTTTRMAYDINGGVWADLDGSNALQTRYIMGVGLQQYFAREDGSGNVYWLVQDTEYTVRDVLNSAGADVDTIAYTAYGNIVSQTGSAYTGVIGYAAYRVIVTANLDLAQGRVYDPVTGKWLENDPIGFRGGLSNLSDYVGDDPTNATDPSGLHLYADGSTVAGDYVNWLRGDANDIERGWNNAHPDNPITMHYHLHDVNMTLISGRLYEITAAEDDAYSSAFLSNGVMNWKPNTFNDGWLLLCMNSSKHDCVIKWTNLGADGKGDFKFGDDYYDLDVTRTKYPRGLTNAEKCAVAVFLQSIDNLSRAQFDEVINVKVATIPYVDTLEAKTFATAAFKKGNNNITLPPDLSENKKTIIVTRDGLQGSYGASIISMGTFAELAHELQHVAQIARNKGFTGDYGDEYLNNLQSMKDQDAYRYTSFEMEAYSLQHAVENILGNRENMARFARVCEAYTDENAPSLITDNADAKELAARFKAEYERLLEGDKEAAKRAGKR